MKDGFVKVAAATPEIRVNDTEFNSEKIIACIKEAAKNGAKILVLPELCITGYTCGDLFLQSSIIKRSKGALVKILRATSKIDMLFAVGLPFLYEDKLYNTVALCRGGKVLAFITKTEFSESRYFGSLNKNVMVEFDGYDVTFGPKTILCAKEIESLKIACAISDDANTLSLANNDATVILNPSASNEIIGKVEYRRMLISSNTLRTISAYIYADAGEGESTTDLVYAGHNIIAECGKILKEANLFENGIICSVIDTEKISLLRRKNTFNSLKDENYQKIYFDMKEEKTNISGFIKAHPFVPSDAETLAKRCENIFAMQCAGLRKRLKHIGLKTVTIGISGGLDSTLALLVAIKTFDGLGLDRKGIVAVTMPCFGTTDRTYNNAKRLSELLGVTLREVNIADSVVQHLKDIGASIEEHDVTYENAQARERTQVLMDIANKNGGIVIGTGDLSELALGFATYNGDHMSMYGVNCSVPKTLIKHLIEYVAKLYDGELKEVLYDISDTPVSPELLPPEEDGRIKQKTEDIVGPYELHDFFLYNMVRFGFSKSKIKRMAEAAFDGEYSAETINKWLDIFMKRFYANQFKRSALPDGPKIGTVGLSPRGDFLIPSDAVFEE